ncbi:hypothetical protein BVRB_040420, partial [Beta vulgaris subsp. vulgaris]
NLFQRLTPGYYFKPTALRKLQARKILELVPPEQQQVVALVAASNAQQLRRYRCGQR